MMSPAKRLSMMDFSCRFSTKIFDAVPIAHMHVTCPAYHILLNLTIHNSMRDSLCGLVVRVPGYRFRGPGSIPGATRFSEKQWVWNGVHSAS
jgi:hypothetical protein